MTIKSVTFKDKDDVEEMLSIFILDNNGEEVDKYTFYNKKEEIEAQQILKSSIQRLPELLQQIYNSTNITFEKEEIVI